MDRRPQSREERSLSLHFEYRIRAMIKGCADTEFRADVAGLQE
jgi:hypothetical protein